MFPRHMQGAMVRLTDGRVGTVEHVWFDHYVRQWAYWVRVPGDLIPVYDVELEAAHDLSA